MVVPLKNLIDQVRSCFQSRFGAQPNFVVYAPGRVNLIGEHTDYNDGFVFPLAIDRYVLIAGSRNSSGLVTVHSSNFGSDYAFTPSCSLPEDAPTWARYTYAVYSTLISEGHEGFGADLLVWGNVPLASGLSSSAALEIASCLAFEQVGAFAITSLERAKLTLRAETEIMGLKCGIMDMFTSAHGVENHALLLDTRNLEYTPIAIPPRVAIVVGDTLKRRGLVESEYNQRQTECREAVDALRSLHPGVALRDYDLTDLNIIQSDISSKVYRRARHVISENLRTLDASKALASNDLARIGSLMNESHYSLRDDFEVSCLELDVLSDICRHQPGCFGSRMTGAGFGGCTVSLVSVETTEEFVSHSTEENYRLLGFEPDFMVCHAVAGAGPATLGGIVN